MAKKHKEEIITRADGSQVKISGYKPPKAAPKAAKFEASIDSSNLPPKVDLRPYMTQIENQGTLGSCTANATAGAYEYLINRNQGIDNYDVSRLFLYYNTRVLEDTVDEDGGGFLYDVLKALATKGICSEQSWPYNIKKFAKKPPKECYEEAKNNCIEKYESVDNELDTWKSVLAQGYPIIFSMHLCSSFMNPRRGRVPMPKRGEEEVGGHAMLCVGYSDPDQVFIVRNSWGQEYGDRGYCYVPYELMMSEYTYDDTWVIYDVNPIDPSQAEESWSDDGESVFVEMGTEFDNMDDETWGALCDELGDYDITYRLGALYGMATVGDDNVSDEEYQAATDKLANILEMFGLNFDAEEVMEHCAELTTVEGFVQETVEILGRYLSPGALATIAKDMYEIAGVDGLDPEEEQFINELVGDWFNEELAEEYDNSFEEHRQSDKVDKKGGKKSSDKGSKKGGKKSSDKGGKGGKKSSGKGGKKSSGKGGKKGRKVRDEDGNIIYIDDDEDWDDDDEDLDDDDFDLDDDDFDDEDDDLDDEDDDFDDEDDDFDDEDDEDDEDDDEDDDDFDDEEEDDDDDFDDEEEDDEEDDDEEEEEDDDDEEEYDEEEDDDDDDEGDYDDDEEDDYDGGDDDYDDGGDDDEED